MSLSTDRSSTGTIPAPDGPLYSACYRLTQLLGIKPPTTNAPISAQIQSPIKKNNGKKIPLVCDVHTLFHSKGLSPTQQCFYPRHPSYDFSISWKQGIMSESSRVTAKISCLAANSDEPSRMIASKKDHQLGFPITHCFVRFVHYHGLICSTFNLHKDKLPDSSHLV